MFPPQVYQLVLNHILIPVCPPELEAVIVCIHFKLFMENVFRDIKKVNHSTNISCNMEGVNWLYLQSVS